MIYTATRLRGDTSGCTHGATFSGIVYQDKNSSYSKLFIMNYIYTHIVGGGLLFENGIFLLKNSYSEKYHILTMPNHEEAILAQMLRHQIK